MYTTLRTCATFLAGNTNPKRNHINRFEAEYEYRYEPMTRDHAAECMRLEAEWRKTRSGHTGELSAEQRAMQRAFAHSTGWDLSVAASTS